MNLIDKEFDFIISIGEDCGCASLLKEVGLRFSSYPFDWITGAKLDKKIDLILNNFNGFFNKEDFLKIEKVPNLVNDVNHDYYDNVKNGFRFMHDFKINLDFDKEYKRNKKKYDKRIKRFYRSIEKADDVLLVYMNTSKQSGQGVYLEAVENIAKRFPKTNISLLAIENDMTTNDIKIQKINTSNKGLLYYSAYDNSTYDISKPELQCWGNIDNNMKLFSTLRLKNKRKKEVHVIIIKKIAKLLSCITPVSKQRKQIRNFVFSLFSE